MDKISEFQGKYRFLSNFWYVGGTTVEHQYQAAKCLYDKDAKKILMAESPSIAKRLGKSVKMREDWESVKLSIMLNLLRWKFNHSEMKSALLETGDAILEEGNVWKDTFWGICPPNSGNGHNHLGELIMKVRDEIRNGQ